MKSIQLRLFSCFALIALIASSGAFVFADTTLDQAKEMSRKTGRPVLAVAGSKSCVHCRNLMKRLSTDESIQSIVIQFVPLKIDTATEQWQQWEREHRSEGNGIPKIYAVRADGETLYAKSGAPQGDNLPKLLVALLKNSGTIYDNEQLQLIYQAKIEFDKNMTDRNVPAAIKSLNALKNVGTPGNLGSYAEELIAFDKSVNDLAALAKKEITDIQQAVVDKQQTGSESIELVRSYNRAFEQYKDFEIVGEAVTELQKVIKSNKDLFQLANDVSVIDRAATEYSLSNKRRLLDEMKEIAARTQNAEILKIVNASIPKLEKLLEPKPRTWTDNTGSFSVYAKFVESSDSSVTLQKQDGAKLEVPIDRLSKTDQRYLRSMK
jgi:hypothetical protein